MLSGLSKDDFENLFSSCHEVNFRKKHVLAIFRIIFQKNLKNVFHHFFCNITKYDCAELYVKSIFLSGFMQWTGGTMYTPWA